MVSLFQRRLSFKGIHMTRFQHHDMVVFVFLHTFSMCKYMCSPSLWQKLPHLVRVDQNICEFDIWKPIDLQTSKAFTLYVFAIIAIDLIGHQDFTGNNKGDGAYPGGHQLNDVGSFQTSQRFFYIEQLWTIDPFDVLAPQKLEDIFKMVAFFWLFVFAQIVVFVVSFDFEVWGISSTQKLDDPILQFSFKKGRVCVGVNNKHRMYVNQFQVWVCPNMWLEFFCCSDLGHGNISQWMDGLSCLTSSSSLIFGILGSIVKTREPGKPPA